MRKILISVFVLMGFLGYSQQKKKSYKKPIKKTIKSVKKEIIPKEYTHIVEDKKEETPIISEIKEEAKANAPKEVNISQQIIQKLSQKNGWIRNRNSVYVRGIEAFVKGIYVNKDKIFIMIDVWNRTNIDYDIESVSFVTSPTKSKEKHIMQEEKIFIPIESNQPERLVKKSKQKLIYAFDKFTISDNINLMFLMDEENGDRSINLPIKADYITNSEYIK